MQQYEKVRQSEQAQEQYNKQEERSKELKFLLKEWHYRHYNRENKDPSVYLDNGEQVKITLWKALPEDY